jgi:hypothetical protein
LVNIMSMSLLFLGVVAWAGDPNARVKGIANCTWAQVPVQSPGRVSSKGPPQYYQTLALPIESVDWFVRLLKDWLSLHSCQASHLCQLFPRLMRHGI